MGDNSMLKFDKFNGSNWQIYQMRIRSLLASKSILFALNLEEYKKVASQKEGGAERAEAGDTKADRKSVV